MKYHIQTFLLILIFSFLTFNSSYAQLGDKVKRFKQFTGPAIGILDDYFQNKLSCASMGYSEEECQNVAVLCAAFNFSTGNAPGIRGQVFNELKLFDVFKPRCGDGICYQCCYANGGCHTSFVGFPVINCNEGNGPDAHAAALTLVTGGEIGQACLYTPQTCEHVPVCYTGLTQEQIDAINNNPDHLMKDAEALGNRFLHWGIELLEDEVVDFLNDVSPGRSIFRSVGEANFNESDQELLRVNNQPLIESLDFVDFYDLFSSRGNAHWREWIEDLSNLNLDQEAFGIYDTLTNELKIGPTLLNFTRQITFARTAASLPNLLERFQFTGSYIWSDAAYEDYITSIGGEPDLLLESQMSPLALHFIKNNRKHQNYRLLAVPLQDEGDQSNFYGGHELGQAPVVQTSYSALPSNKIDLNVALFTTGTHQSQFDFDGTVYWGDGTVTHFTLSDLFDRKKLSHTYKEKGHYQAFTVVQNSSGLRSFKMNAIEISTNANPVVSSLPVINELIFEDLSITSWGYMFWDVTKMAVNISIGENSNRILAGQSQTTIHQSAHPKIIDNVLATNFGLINADTIYIEPLLVNDVLTGANAWFAFSNIKAKVYNPATDQDIIFDLPVDLSNIVFTDTDGNRRTEDLSFDVTETGQKAVYMEYQDFNLSTIAIPIDLTTLANNYISAQATTTTDNNTYIEIRPNVFETYQLPDCSQNVNNLPNGTLVSYADLIETNSIIEDGQSVALIAEESVLLLEDFCTQLGGEFLADIGVCIPANLMRVPNPDSEIAIENDFEFPEKIVDQETSFYFNLHEDNMLVNVKLMNLTGTLHTFIIHNKLYGKGQHQFRFTKGDIPSGLYQLVFELNGEVQKIEKFKLL